MRSRGNAMLRTLARLRRITVSLGILSAAPGFLLTSRCTAGGYTPEEAVARMKLPEGFHAEIFAAEPMVRQPLSLNFDARGRAWVIEYLQYPTPAGLKPVTVDQYLRTEYDKVPEPPPRGPKGVDRIKILEDTDGDGRADRQTVFVEGLNLASGLAVGHGGVYIVQAPYLLFYADKNHDDRPDGDPEVLLSGFGLQDAHATANSLQFGPDGWLYGAQGSTVTAKIRGIEFQQGIWRFHPVTHEFELFAEGGGNTWGLDFDPAGNTFGSSNGSFITFHIVQGGNYWKGFTKHGPLHNPNTFGYFDAVAYEGPKVGGHVTPGGIIYKAKAYPDRFRGAFIGGNLLSNAVYWHDLKPNGSTFKARHGGTLLDAHDNWFRPIDLQVGPDGCVYVVDWYDRRASHLDPRDNWDKTNGRIYRVVHGERKRVAPFDLSKLSSAELVELRTADNDWYAAQARLILAERRDASIIPALKEYLAHNTDETVALRDLWALHASGGLDDSMALVLLDHKVPAVRRWTVRLLGDSRRMNPSLHSSLVQVAASDADPLVRSQLAASCQRWASNDALPILEKLVTRAGDEKDPHIPLMLWWAFERQLRDDREGVVNLLTTPLMQGAPMVRQVLIERVARVLAARGSASDLAACARLLVSTDGSVRWEAVKGMEQGLQGRRVKDVPPELTAFLTHYYPGDKAKKGGDLQALACRLGSRDAVRDAIALIRDRKAPLPVRTRLMELLGQLGSPEALPLYFESISDPGCPLHAPALNALGNYQSPEVAALVIKAYPSLPTPLKDRALSLLCTRTAWAATLLDALGSKSIPSNDVRPPQVAQILQLGDPALRSRIEKVWGRVPGPGSPEKLKRIAEVRGSLPEGDKGNPTRGHAVFKEHCAVCHKLFGEGESIGPELTGAERGNLEFLLASVIDPSSMIRKEYQSQSVALRDGRVLTGLIVEETAKSLTVIDSNRQKTLVSREDVEEIRPSPISLMPEGVVDKLPEDQVRDLFRYLQSSGPGPK